MSLPMPDSTGSPRQVLDTIEALGCAYVATFKRARRVAGRIKRLPLLLFQ